jgi:hypothetical protein
VNIILIYVDDLLVFATKEVIDLVFDTLRNQFTWLTVECEEQSFSYLGMQLIWLSEQVVIDMKYYLQQVLDGVTGLQRKSIPGGRETFQVKEESVSVGTEQASWYHTIMAKLLYLAKRARPDILTVVSFLCTRVTNPMVDDIKKLNHLLGYLHGTRDKVLVINKRRGFQLKCMLMQPMGYTRKESPILASLFCLEV